MAKWCEKMEEESQGRLKFEIYYSGTLVPVTDVLTSVGDGFADIGFIPGNLGADYFPISSKLMSMPFIPFPSTEAANAAYNAIREEYPELDAEYEVHGIKNLGAYFMVRNDIYFPTATTVVKPEELKGMKIGVASAFMTSYLKDIGAAPVFVTNADLYTSMDNGVVSGLVQHLALLNSTSTVDVVKAATFIGDYGMLRDLGIFGMNLDKYNSLPEDLQAILDKGFRGVCEDNWKEDDVQFDKISKELENFGAVLTYLSEEEAQVWLASAQDIHEATIAELDAEGLPAQAIYDRMIEICEGY